jgi:hypothetical protein
LSFALYPLLRKKVKLCETHKNKIKEFEVAKYLKLFKKYLKQTITYSK